MKTYGDDIVVNASSIQEGEAVVSAIRRLRERQIELHELDSSHWGHDFQTHDRRCACGKTRIEFDIEREHRELCQLARPGLRDIFCDLIGGTP